MRKVGVIGIGIVKFGELWEKSLRDIFVEAALKSIEDAGVTKIDSMYIGTMSSGLFTGQEHIGALLSDYLGVTPIPSIRVESACASGGVAFRQAFIEVASGISDIVLAGGVEKMTDVDGSKATYILGTAADQEYESFNGATFPGLYALICRVYMEKYGLTREELSYVAVKNHKHGSLNPYAQFPKEVTIEQVENSPLVADPLRLLDCSPITDGAAAVILCPLEKAKEISKNTPIQVLGSGMATDTIALHQRKNIEFFESTSIAMKKALDMAKIDPKKIDFAEVHDCFTIAEICVLESLGLYKPGEAKSLAKEGVTSLEGEFPVNVSGGLKSKGHPVGATGIAQIVEIVSQLRGEAGKRQIKNPKIGLAQNMGGTAASSVVHILGV